LSRPCVEQVIANFVRENWSKLGLFLYFLKEFLTTTSLTDTMRIRSIEEFDMSSVMS